jgi:RimJ/RimL family protein N-acetyltransferase
MPAAPGALPLSTADRPDWCRGLPTLRGTLVTLREPRAEDALSLFAALACPEVSRFISPPPVSVEGFGRFISWAHRQRAAGRQVAFVTVPDAAVEPVGLFQVRAVGPDFGTAEWGFALGSDYWGSGMFGDGARLVLDFVIDVLGTRRLEARAALQNGRGNGALRKLGAVQEGVLRRSFLRDGEYLDQVLWALLADEWRHARVVPEPRIVH